MKNLKILFLVFVLLFSCSTIFAQDVDQTPAATTAAGVVKSNQNKPATQHTRAKKTPQYTVEIIISETQKVSCKVDSGKCTFDEDFIKNNVPAFNPHMNGNSFKEWQVSGVNVGDKIVRDVKVIALWVPESEVQREQDSLMWQRLNPYVEQLVDNKIEELKGQYPKNDFWLYVMLGLAILLSITSIVLSLLLPKKYQKHLQDNEDFAEAVVNIVKKHKESEKWNNAGKVAVKSTESPSTSYDSDIRDLRGRVNVLEDKLRNSTKENTTTVTTSSSQENMKVPASSEQYLYADSIVNDKFNRVKESPGEDSIFELKLKGGSKATVTIYKPAYNKVLANPSYLEGCDKQIMGYTSVNIDREGTAEKDDNGKWKVVTPLKVVLK